MSNPSDKQSIEEAIRNQLGGLEELPSLPAVIPRLLSVLEQPESDASDVSEILQMDPGLTAKVFKLINSAYYGLRRQINSVREAVTYIGFNTVRNLALTAGVVDHFSHQLENSEATMHFDWYEFWKYSVATGIAAGTVGRHLRVPNHENALASGILHRLGLLVLQTHFEPLLNKIAEQHEGSEDLLALEREILGFDDQDLGLWLTQHWDFPEAITAGIGFHARPHEYHDQNPDEELKDIPTLVHVGKRLAHRAGYHLSIDSDRSDITSNHLKLLGLDRQAIPVITKQYKSDLKDARVFMELVQEIEDQ